MVTACRDHVTGLAVRWASDHFSTKSICLAAIMFLTQGMELNMSCTLPLHRRCSCTFVIKIWRMRRMLRWRNPSNLSSFDFCSNQVSAPHRSRFIGIARKRRCLFYMSRWGLRHSSFKAPIEAFAAAILAVISSSSCRL